jgi:hypothetical protein
MAGILVSKSLAAPAMSQAYGLLMHLIIESACLDPPEYRCQATARR